MHLVTHGHFQSHDKDSSYTIRSAIVENPMLHANLMQGSHYILLVKFKDLSRTLKLHFQEPILEGSLQHGQYYSNI